MKAAGHFEIPPSTFTAFDAVAPRGPRAGPFDGFSTYYDRLHTDITGRAWE